MRHAPENKSRHGDLAGAPRPAKLEEPWGPKPKSGGPLFHPSAAKTLGQDADRRADRLADNNDATGGSDAAA